MSEQPREFDVVLGGKNPPPVTGVVLGGIEGVKQRLESEIVDVRIKALNDAFKYGDEGLDLVIQALENDSLQVQGFASRLLKEWGGEKGKQALLEFDPYLYFTKLDDWEVEEFNPEVGIMNPEGKAYVVNLGNIQLFIQDKRVSLFPNSLYCGVDLMILPDWEQHAVLEINAFGDLLPGVLWNGVDTYESEIKAIMSSN